MACGGPRRREGRRSEEIAGAVGNALRTRLRLCLAAESESLLIARREDAPSAVGVHELPVILDSVGGQNLVESIAALAYRGSLVSVGVAARAGSNIEAKDLWAKNNALRGVFLGGALLASTPASTQ